jgi:hypothetical protein
MHGELFYWAFSYLGFGFFICVLDPFFLCKAFRQDPDYAQHVWGMEGGMTEQRFKLCTKRGLLVGHWVGHTGIEVEIFGWGAASVCVRVKARGFLRALLLRDILDFRLQNC